VRDIATRKTGVGLGRARALDSAIQESYQKQLPVRIVVFDGKRRKDNAPNPTASKVQYRHLDPESWHVAKYDNKTGQTTLMRGIDQDSYNFVDQFDIYFGAPAATNERTVSVFVRRPDIRRRVLKRANGKCELCGAKGFVMANDKIYLETHHIVPLCEKGTDSESNVAALCPNHHREAHHGENCVKIRGELIRKLQLINVD
jgi:5-methylcytosine-specific restriction protein A